MIPFPFNENWFSFFCSRPSSSRSEMHRCTTHGLYQSKLWQQDHYEHLENTNPDGSTLESTSQRIGQPFGGGGAEGQIMSPHTFEVGLKVNTKVYLDVLKSVVIPWCNQVAGGRPWVWQQDSALAHKSKETQAWLQKECYDFVPFSHWSSSSPDLNPLDYFVWSYVENITNMTSHNTKASLIAAIRRAPDGACGKGMLPIPDPHRGRDWGWRRLHRIDVSSTT